MNPYPSPSPKVLSDMCAMQAWEEKIDDHTRLLLEWSADELRRLMDRCTRLAAKLEQAEARSA
jgi:hypothetical protein